MRPIRRLLAAFGLAVRDADRAGAATMAGIVLITTGLAVAAPRLFERSADERLHQALTAASADERNLAFARVANIPSSEGDPLAQVTVAGAELQGGLPPSVGELVTGRTQLVGTIEHLVTGAPQAVTQARLRIEPAAADRIRYVEGRAPGPDTPVVVLADRLDRAGVPYEAIRYEASLSREAADLLLLGVGDRLVLAPEVDESIRNLVSSGDAGYSLIDITGIYEPVDPADPGWYGDIALQRVVEEVISIDLSIYHATFLLDPAVYPALVAPQPGSSLADAPFPLTYEWRMLLEPTRLDGGEVAAVSTDLQRLQAAHPFQAATTGEQPPGLRTGLRSLLERFGIERGSAERALLAVGVGPAAAAAGAILLIALLSARRRRAATLLVRARGASTTQVLLGRLAEALALAVPSAIIGAGLAFALIPSRTTAVVVGAGVAVVVFAVLAVVAVAGPAARATAGDTGSERGPVRALEPRRLVLEGAIVAVAVGSLVALQGRGIASAPLGSVDPFLAAAPVLVGLAASVVALRAYPLALAAAAATVGGRRGPVVPIALRSSSRGPLVGRLPILVVLTATALAVLASALLTTLESAQVAGTWREVGADVKVSTPPGRPLPPQLDVSALASIPGVVAAAEAYRLDAGFAGGSIRSRTVDFLALDVPAYERVTSGSPVPSAFPAAFHDPPPAATGPDAPAIPAVVSRELARVATLGVGDEFTVSGAGIDPPLVVAAIADGMPDQQDAEFILAPLARLQAASRRELSPQTIYLRTTPEALGPVRAVVTPYDTTVDLIDRRALAAALADTPLMVAVRGGFGAAVVIALAYSAMALWASLALAIAARRRDLALLRTMGISTREVLGLVLVEHGPLIVVGLAAGLGLGLGLAALLIPAMGLEGLAGPDPRIRLTIDPATIALVGVLPIAVVSTIVLAGVWFARRADLARAIRVADR